jgi:hypothetical protein
MSTNKKEFLSLTDYQTGEPIYLDASQITLIQQIAANDTHSRYTRIAILSSTQHFLVSEEALAVALASGRGFWGPKDDLNVQETLKEMIQMCKKHLKK